MDPQTSDELERATRSDTPGSELARLSLLSTPEVKQAVARNPAAPRQALENLLTSHPDDVLARKLRFLLNVGLGREQHILNGPPLKTHQRMREETLRDPRLQRAMQAVATTENSDYAAIENHKLRMFGLQFHPEVAHTPRGREIISNFVHGICGCGKEWTMRNYVDQAVEQIRSQVGKDRVILGLSGGVDSSVAAALLHKAIGDQLTCIFVNNGLLRAKEAEVVQEVFGRNFRIRLQYENASALFLRRLKGVTDPERKRKIIGRTFIEVFQSATRRAGKARFLAQGTLYPDVIESVPIAGNPAALIKSHHNVGGLPKNMKFQLVEPLRCLFKDEVRQLGVELGLPKEIVHRQPFPGPGLAVRVLGEVTPARCAILREADSIVVEEMKKAGWYYKIWQSFAVLLPVRSVGVMGDERTYDYTVAVRAVESQDGMTADWVRLPGEILETLSSRIINEVKGVNRVVFDITSKPPGTIEWE